MKKTRLLAILLALALCASLFSGCSGGEYKPNKEDASVVENMSEKFDGGSGTEQDPYLIATAEQLRRLGELVHAESYKNHYAEAYYLLTADIDLGGEESPWTPIGDDGNNDRPPFMGFFDGGGHTVSNMYIDYNSKTSHQKTRTFGLFGTVYDGEVKNLTLAKSTILVNSEDSDESGGIIGDLRNGAIENCEVLADVSLTGIYCVGGVVGNVGSDSFVVGCRNEASVKSTSAVGYAGGIVAYMGGEEITDCVNIGNVTGSDAGGIVCSLNSAMSRCENSGIISSNNARGCAGGIAAFFSVSSFVNSPDDKDITVSDCINSGTVGAPITAGGIFGDVSNSGAYSGEITNCSNSGTVMAYTAGGIVGEYSQMSENEVRLTFSDCTNTGMLAVANKGESSRYGGILGEAVTIVGTVEFLRCVNSGDIYGDDGTCGGIFGCCINGGDADMAKTQEIVFTDCQNDGDVSGGSIGVGGVMGAINSYVERPTVVLKMEGCTNTGELSFIGIAACVGGMTGIIEPFNVRADFIGCRNTGKLAPNENNTTQAESALNYKVSLGGIVGRIGEMGMSGLESALEHADNTGPITFTDCVNEGEFVTLDDGQVYITEDIYATAESWITVEVN